MPQSRPKPAAIQTSVFACSVANAVLHQPHHASIEAPHRTSTLQHPTELTEHPLASIPSPPPRADTLRPQCSAAYRRAVLPRARPPVLGNS